MAIWSRSICPVNIVPRKIQRKDWWKEAKSHHKAASLIIQTSVASISEVPIWLRLNPFAYRPVRYRFLRTLIVATLPTRVLVVVLREYGGELVLRDAAFADGADERVPRLL